MAVLFEAPPEHDISFWQFAEAQFPEPATLPFAHLGAEDNMEPSAPLFISVAEMESDDFTRHRAARFIGEVLAENMVEAAETIKLEKPIDSLRDAIHWAAKGDQDGRNLVDVNVETEMIEQTLKTGHVTDPVPLFLTADGKLIQHNQTGDSIQANSLQLTSADPTMRERTKAETRNKFRIEDLYAQGLFEDYSLVVFSLAEDMPDLFFTGTMTCSIQVTSKAEGGLQLESAFVAGVAEPGADRHDLDTIAKVGDMLDVDYRNKTSAEIIDRPVLIHNSLIRNGAVDVVELLWDKASGTFFGENKVPPCSYQKYRELCHERTASFRPRVDIVRDQLISEAPQIKTRLQATERLHELSEKQMVEKAVEDYSIDPRVFGPVAAPHIELARQHQATGDAGRMSRELKWAIKTAQSISCPTAGAKKVKLEVTETLDSLVELDDVSFDNADEDESDRFGSLVFKCTEGHVNTRKKGELLKKCQTANCKGSVGCGEDKIEKSITAQKPIATLPKRLELALAA